MHKKDRHPTAFVSYSWDSTEHQNWVKKLVNQLREKYGVDATMDLFETQSKTVNLNSMMISGIRDSDYVIIILTENYAKKAEEESGGVGFETMIAIPEIQSNQNKIILAVRHKGEFNKAIPTYLRGFHAFDFSNDDEYEQNLLKLSHRIYQVDFHNKAPLGDIPNFNDIKKNQQEKDNILSDFLEDINVSKTKHVTDLDKEKFIEESFENLNSLLKHLLDEVQKQDNTFKYTYEQITSKKVLFKIYFGGMAKGGLKIWLGSWTGSGSSNINLSQSLDPHNDNSMNEIITCKVDNNNELKLEMTMNMFGNKSPENMKELVREIWKNHIERYIH